jgi:CheY-like chemotaxis protein
VDWPRGLGIVFDDVEMSDALWIKLIGAIPAILWVVFAASVYFTLRGAIVQRIMPRLTAVRALGVEVELAGELLDQAHGETQATVAATARLRALGRLKHAADVLQGGKVLWVDDRPDGNTPLIALLRNAGVEIDVVFTTAEVIPLFRSAPYDFRRKPYDIIISDVERGGDPQAGIKMLRQLEQYNINVPVLIFAGQFDPEKGVDRRIFAGTSEPVDLIHYVIDLMERSRLGPL